MITREVSQTALLTSLIIVCSYITIPIQPVPITLQTLAILLIGLIASPKQALTATSLYLLMGLIGLPVGPNYHAGLAKFLSPSYGFVIGFIPAASLAALYLEKVSRRSTRHLIIAALIASLILYAIGLPYIGIILNSYLGGSYSFLEILKLGLIPFIPGDLIKLTLAILMAQRLLASRSLSSYH